MNLIEVGYFASLTQEEGRQIRCSLFCSGFLHEVFDISKFEPPIRLDVEALRKLSPIVQSDELALRVRFDQQTPFAFGIKTFSIFTLGPKIGRPLLGDSGGELGVAVHLLAPGHLRVDDGILQLELQAGRIRICRDLRFTPPVSELLTDFSKRVFQRLQETENLSVDDLKLFGGLDLHRWDSLIIELLLRPIVDAGHGGTLLIVDCPESPPCISKLKTVSGMDLGQCCVDFLRQCVVMNREGCTDYEQHARRWALMGRKLLITAKSIAGLANVDGCVVLDRGLRVIGFGGQINLSESDAESSPITFYERQSAAEIPVKQLTEGKGMRHKSAILFCKANDDTVAFVVSQDRHMTVLSSSDRRASLFSEVSVSTVPKSG